MPWLRLLPSSLLVLALLSTMAAPVAAADCQFILGFAALKTLLDAAEGPDKVGQCLEGQHFNPANGDALQRTTGGLLVWRKVDNWTAFTDGYRTWINGPHGLQSRLNTEQFDWEPDPWPPARAVSLGTAHQFQKQGVLFDPPYKWELTVLNVEREPAYDYRISGEKVLLPDQESIVVEAQIKAIGSGQLGDDYGLFSYVACTGSVGYGSSSRCYRRASLSPFVLVMQNGEEGKRRNHETFGLPAGATKTVRLAWYIWREQEAVLAIRMASGQRELSAYTGIFALR